MLLIVGLLKDLVVIFAGIVSTYKTYLEIRKLKNPDEKHQDLSKH